jgi:hypothetical protein
MTPTAQKIKELLDGLAVKEESLPVFFNGAEGPRHIGWASNTNAVDMLLMTNQLSATFISKAQVEGDNRSFFVVYG